MKKYIVDKFIDLGFWVIQLPIWKVFVLLMTIALYIIFPVFMVGFTLGILTIIYLIGVVIWIIDILVD